MPTFYMTKKMGGEYLPAILEELKVHGNVQIIGVRWRGDSPIETRTQCSPLFFDIDELHIESTSERFEVEYLFRVQGATDDWDAYWIVTFILGNVVLERQQLLAMRNEAQS